MMVEAISRGQPLVINLQVDLRLRTQFGTVAGPFLRAYERVETGFLISTLLSIFSIREPPRIAARVVLETSSQRLMKAPYFRE